MKLIQGLGGSIIALAIALSFAGCGKQEEAKGSQVAAKVNGDEITVHQINFELSRLGNPDPAQAEQVTAKILNGLVDQQLFLQQAFEEKLDRDPRVVQALDENRRKILASAYVERLAQNVAKPTDAEIKDFYARNPALFSERRIYKIEELQIQTTPQNTAAIKSRLAESRNLDDFGEWLKSGKIPFRAAQSVKPAEQLPVELLPRMHAMKDGQALTLIGNNQITVLFLMASQTQPLAEEAARPAVERYLVNLRKRELVDANLKKLRASARIEYKGKYAGIGKPAETPTSPAAASPAPATPVQPAPAQPATTRSDQEAIDKGVQGLK
jgi:EpsD family peptidyl-prolyl cis-trans isomerase